MVAPLTATFIWLQHQKAVVKSMVKKNMISGLDKQELILLKFTEEECQSKLNWEHSKEFEYNDQMYDIIATHKEGDTTYFWCWPDNEETELNKQLNDLLAYTLGKDPERKDAQKQLNDIFDLFYHFQNLENVHFFNRICPIKSCYSFSSVIFAFSPAVPPPELS